MSERLFDVFASRSFSGIQALYLKPDDRLVSLPCVWLDRPTQTQIDYVKLFRWELAPDEGSTSSKGSFHYYSWSGVCFHNTKRMNDEASTQWKTVHMQNKIQTETVAIHKIGWLYWQEIWWLAIFICFEAWNFRTSEPLWNFRQFMHAKVSDYFFSSKASIGLFKFLKPSCNQKLEQILG